MLFDQSGDSIGLGDAPAIVAMRSSGLRRSRRSHSAKALAGVMRGFDTIQARGQHRLDACSRIAAVATGRGARLAWLPLSTACVSRC